MKATVGVGIFEQPVTGLFIEHTELLFIFLGLHGEVVPVDEVVARVVRRVNVDQLDLAEIALLQKLKDFQIVSLDIEVFRAVPVHALLRAGAQRLADGLVGLHNGRLLAYPGKLICLVAVHHVARQHLPQQLKVDRLFQLSVLAPRLRHTIRKQRRDLLNIPLRHVRGLKFHVIH